jgi:hypothetical protein
VPHISLVFREMWDTTAANSQSFAPQTKSFGFVASHISRKTSEIPRVSCSLRRTKPGVRLSLMERRMKFAEPNKLSRKSGLWGTPCSVAEERAPSCCEIASHKSWCETISGIG